MNEQQFQEVLKRIDKLAEFSFSRGGALSETLVREVALRGFVMSAALLATAATLAVIAKRLFAGDDIADDPGPVVGGAAIATGCAICFALALEFASDALCPTLTILEMVMP